MSNIIKNFEKSENIKSDKRSVLTMSTGPPAQNQ
jgi:hypothetical protein